MRTYIGVNELRGISSARRHAMEREILACNDETAVKGLVLTPEDAEILIETRNKALREARRTEIGAGGIVLLIRTFFSSSYLTPERYASELRIITEAFYCFKGESRDHMNDQALAALLFDYYENREEGVASMLLGRDYERLLRQVKGSVRYRLEGGHTV